MEKRAEIGIFGGSGFYSFLEDVEYVKVDTPFGPPSDLVALSTIDGRKVAFLPRHGRNHEWPPHAIPYRANVWAMRELGVTRVIGPCAAGSLQPGVRPGDFVVCDQFVDRTWGREDTFYHGHIVTHISAADPYCPELRSVAIRVAKEMGMPIHERGTVVVIQGPRFSTRAESKWYSQMGWTVVNMTQYPECILAKELDMCYLNISLITDYDVGLEDREDIKPVTHEEVIRVFNENNEKLRKLLFRLVSAIPVERGCTCGESVRLGR